MTVAMLVFLAKLVASVLSAIFKITGRRMPKTLDQAQKYAEAIYPTVARGRALAARAQNAAIRTHMREKYNLDVTPAPPRPYVLNATFRAVCNASGLTPPDRTDGAGVDDGRTPARPKTVEEFQQRLGLSLEQHVRNASREMIIDTANLNEVEERDGGLKNRSDDDEDYEELYDFSTDDFEAKFKTADDWWAEQEEDLRKVQTAKEGETAKVLTDAANERQKKNVASERRRPGVVLGWARVLSGETNCAFCAMLASRGAVYRSSVTAGFRPHLNCDCHVELVVKGQRWLGDSEAAALQDLWEDARDHPNEYEQEQRRKGRLLTPAARFRSRFEKLVKSDQLSQFKSDSAQLAADRIAQMNLPYRVSFGGTKRRKGA